jgi:hypothetical protein
MPEELSRYPSRPKAGSQVHLCPEKDIETALDLADPSAELRLGEMACHPVRRARQYFSFSGRESHLVNNLS